MAAAFKFDPKMHEPGPKFVLGHHIKPKVKTRAGKLLHRLATSPQTAPLHLAEARRNDSYPTTLR